MLARILQDNPKMDTNVALAWAVTAKNSYPTHCSFRSFQLVLGKQPKIPNVMEDKLPAQEGLMHITAMHVGRKAFTEALYDEKVRKALRHNLRGGVLQAGQRQGKVAQPSH